MDFTLSDEILAKKAAARPLGGGGARPPLRAPGDRGAPARRAGGGPEGGGVLRTHHPQGVRRPGLDARSSGSACSRNSRRGYAMVRMIGPHHERALLAPARRVRHRGAEAEVPARARVAARLWAANSLTEPEGGTGKDMNAKCVKDGDHYVLNGHKWLITQFPGYTKLLYAFASTEDEGAHLLPGRRALRGPGPRAHGADDGLRRARATTTCYYHDLPRARGERSWARRARGSTSPSACCTSRARRIAFCCVGLAQKMLDLAVAYAKQRTTFGKKLSTPPGHPAQPGPDGHRDRGRPPARPTEPPGGSTRAWTSSRDAAMAKLFAEQVVTRVAEMALRIHGGVGYTQAYPLERHFRDARSFHFEEGTEEIQKLLIARQLLGRYRTYDCAGADGGVHGGEKGGQSMFDRSISALRTLRPSTEFDKPDLLVPGRPAPALLHLAHGHDDDPGPPRLGLPRGGGGHQPAAVQGRARQDLQGPVYLGFALIDDPS